MTLLTVYGPDTFKRQTAVTTLLAHFNLVGRINLSSDSFKVIIPLYNHSIDDAQYAAELYLFAHKIDFEVRSV